MRIISFNQQDPKRQEWAQANLDAFCSRPTQVALREQYISRGLVPTGNLGARILNLYDNEQEVPLSGYYELADYQAQNILKRTLDDNPRRLGGILSLCRENRQLQNHYAQLRFGRSPQDQDRARAIAPYVDEVNWKVEVPLNDVLWSVAPLLEEVGVPPVKFCIKSGPGDIADVNF